ncbi:MAG: MFS transporter, partial [Solirubrobacterales bacterium]
TTDQAYQGLRDAGLSADDATTVTNDYATAQLDALKTSMLAVAFLSLLSVWFARRLPGKRQDAA